MVHLPTPTHSTNKELVQQTNVNNVHNANINSYMLTKETVNHNNTCGLHKLENDSPLPQDVIINIATLAEGRQVSIHLSDGDKKIVALVDTGAGLSLISATLVDDKQLSGMRPIYGFRILTASKEPLDLKGIIDYIIYLGNLEINFEAVVCTDMAPNMIVLGNDFNSKHINSINYDDQTITLKMVHHGRFIIIMPRTPRDRV